MPHHLFAYGDADPVNRIDPLGTQTMVDTAILSRVVIVAGAVITTAFAMRNFRRHAFLNLRGGGARTIRAQMPITPIW